MVSLILMLKDGHEIEWAVQNQKWHMPKTVASWETARRWGYVKGLMGMDGGYMEL